MNFITLDEERFTEFAKNSQQKSFYQTVEIAKLREKNGWTPYYLGVEQNGEIVAASMIVAKPAFLGKSIFYAPGGPLIDYENTALMNFFIFER